MRKIQLRQGDGEENLLERLRAEQIYVPVHCGGRGICGKCRVRFCADAPAAMPDEQRFFTEEELAAGWRLACRTVLEGAAELEVPGGDEEAIVVSTAFTASGETKRSAPESAARPVSGRASFSVSGGAARPVSGRASFSASGGGACPASGGAANKRAVEAIPADDAEHGGHVIAVDLGTTTLAAALVNRTDGQILETATTVNHQRTFGTDVVSRMDASNNGNGGRLQELILADLRALAERLGADPDASQYVIAGNTTMQHLLQGLSCRTLGVAPYRPVDLSLHSWRNMQLLPGISTFVGADIVSGIIATEIDRSEEICLLVDLGTNGEMVIGNRAKLLCTSTAAGPAFEGGNISCGMAGVPGAVSAVEIRDGRAVIRTIGGMPAAGLCGTGVLEVMYELVKEELVDETGLMDDAYADRGFPLAEGVVFTDRDVREVQLAKSAVRAGVEILLQAYGAGYDDVAHIYLAGGFGERINQEKAIGIGLLPEAFAGRIIPVGNSSLAGAVLAAGDPACAARLVAAAERAEEISLAEHPSFNDLYMEHMFFPDNCWE